MQKSNDRKMTIEAELPVPLGEIQDWLKKEGIEHEDIAELIEGNKEKISAEVKVVFEEFLRLDKVNVQIKEIEHLYNDSSNTWHGVAYFKAKLRGTEEELRKAAGENQLFLYEWDKKAEKH